MSGLRSMMISTFFTMTVLASGRAGRCLPTSAPAGEEAVSCNLGSLPSDIQNRLKSNFRAWEIQESENLSKYARQTWKGRNPLKCPGVAVGLFQSIKTPSYAILLVPVDRPDAGYRFVIFSLKSESAYEMALVEQSDDRGSSNYFIRTDSINKFFNEESKRKFDVEATEGVLMVDSAEQEYETDIYFWSNGHYLHEAVDN